MRRWIPLFCLLCVSCIDDAPKVDPGTGLAATVAPAQFDWSMITTVNLRVVGTATAVPVRNTLSVAHRDGSLYLRRWTLMSESVTLPLSVPVTTDSLVVSFGTIQKRLPIVDGELLFDFITPNPEPELILDPDV
ncbi:MAG: hypothetical protein AB7C90_09890 [Bacteroidales bacterium]